MEIRHGSSRLWGFFVLIVLCIFLVAPSAQAQNVEDDPDFIVTLALMAVADDRLDGVMDLSALSNLRSVVDDYYNQKSYLQMDADTAASLNHQKQVILSSLDKKIQNQKTLTARAQVSMFIAMTDITRYKYQRDPALDPFNIYYSVLSSGYKPNPEAVAMLKARLSASTADSLQQNLDGHVADGVQGGRALLNESSPAVYDFDAGKAGEQGGSLIVQPRPLNFTNYSSKTVHVSIEYYQPPKGLAVGTPAMNIEVPGQGTVVMTGFPQGNYVFCVDWLTNRDTNGDGQNDYDRAIQRAWVSASHSADTQQAQVVSVGASFSETPTGRCDGFKGEAPQSETVMTETFMTESDIYTAEQDSEEPVNPEFNADFWNQDEVEEDGEEPAPTEEISPVEEVVPTEEDVPVEPGPVQPGLSLTPAEMANQGTHSYSMTCQIGDTSETNSFVATWEFSESGVSYLEQGLFYARVSTNIYQTDWPTIITFTTGGYLTSSHYFETNSDGQEVKYPIQCTATFQ